MNFQFTNEHFGKRGNLPAGLFGLKPIVLTARFESIWLFLLGFWYFNGRGYKILNYLNEFNFFKLLSQYKFKIKRDRMDSGIIATHKQADEKKLLNEWMYL